MTESERPEERGEEEETAPATGAAEGADGTAPATDAPASAEAPAPEAAGDPAAEAPDETGGDEPATDPSAHPELELGQPAAPGPDQAPEPAPVEDPEAVEPPSGEPAPERPERARGERRRGQSGAPQAGDEAIPGAHLEPDLVLEEPEAEEEPDYSRYAAVEPEAELEAEAADAGDPDAATAPAPREEPSPEPRSALDLAADARYRATGKRKTSVARVTLKPGTGTYTINGRPLERFFPRATLQLAARQPLQTAGYEERMDVVARLHGGGVSSQAGALRHGVARALVEADPALRGELKRRGFLTRDARAKERRKAGLKKARKRPQFSKR